MTRATYSATPLLRSLVFRPQGGILVHKISFVLFKSSFLSPPGFAYISGEH